MSRKIGAIIVRDNIIISTGYNGPPRGVPQCGENNPVEARDVCPRQILNYKSGIGLHLCPAAHAEANAIVSAARLGVSVKNATMYVNCEIPCKDCLVLIINSGIVKVVCETNDLYDGLSFYILNHSNLTIEVF